MQLIFLSLQSPKSLGMLYQFNGQTVQRATPLSEISVWPFLTYFHAGKLVCVIDCTGTMITHFLANHTTDAMLFMSATRILQWDLHFQGTKCNKQRYWLIFTLHATSAYNFSTRKIGLMAFCEAEKRGQKSIHRIQHKQACVYSAPITCHQLHTSSKLAAMHWCISTCTTVQGTVSIDYLSFHIWHKKVYLF